MTPLASQRNLPHGALDYTEMFLLSAIDAALAAQNAVVAAEALGLGTVYIGAIRNRPLDVAAELQLPPRVFPVFGLCVGWPDPAGAAQPKPRVQENDCAGNRRNCATSAPMLLLMLLWRCLRILNSHPHR